MIATSRTVRQATSLFMPRPRLGPCGLGLKVLLCHFLTILFLRNGKVCRIRVSSTAR